MYCRVEPWASTFTLHCSSSPNCMDEYLAVDSVRIVIAHQLQCDWIGFFTDQSRWCSTERVCRGVKINHVNWTLRYIRMYLYHNIISIKAACTWYARIIVHSSVNVKFI